MSNEISAQFSAFEQAAICAIADKFHNGTRTVDVNDLPQASEEIRESCLRRLVTYNLLAPVPDSQFRHGIQKYNVQGPLCLLADRIKNPTPVDYWEKSTTWFRSKPWSLPVLVLFWGLPAIWVWVDAARNLLKWFGLIAKE